MPSDTVTILFFGDVVGPLGRKAVKKYLSINKEKLGVDFVIANGENATHGHGLSFDHYKELLSYGVDVLTNGNHFFNSMDPFDAKHDFAQALRPYNLDKNCPGIGTKIFALKDGTSIRVTNLLGRVFMPMAQGNPFYALDAILAEDSNQPLIHIVDMHAEATAEKRCLAEYADGRVTAVLGTHTHVQTNDLKTLDKGTLFITDVGMNAAYDSVLGDVKEGSIRRTMTGMPADLTVPRKGRILVNAVLFRIDRKTRMVTEKSLINEILEDDLN